MVLQDMHTVLLLIMGAPAEVLLKVVLQTQVEEQAEMVEQIVYQVQV
tara:strand:- start:203 stop:343 length:141 start_codon:yes stop_codon:yes gene_type:complete